MNDKFIDSINWMKRNISHIVRMISFDGELKSNEAILKNANISAEDQINSPLEHAAAIYLSGVIMIELADCYAQQLSKRAGSNHDMVKSAREIMDEIHAMAKAKVESLSPNQIPF